MREEGRQKLTQGRKVAALQPWGSGLHRGVLEAAHSSFFYINIFTFIHNCLAPSIYKELMSMRWSRKERITVI